MADPGEARRGRPRRSTAPDFAAMAAKEAAMDAAIQRVSRAPTAEELERKRQLAVAAEERKAARAAKEAEKAPKKPRVEAS